jgi:D-alanyl-lipoteichoic acid acyltransferase DltB (MBOAT superfamily)
MENFQRPYHAASISAFWQRWHISLSSWFRDYVYVPLGGNRASRPVWFRNLLITFTISGLWHGANWTYVVWGFVNGVYLVSGVILKPFRERFWALIGVPGPHALRTAAGVVVVFVLSCVAWTIFRAQNLGDALYVLSHFWQGWDVAAITTPQFLLRQLPVAVLSIVVLELVESLNQRVSVTALLARQPTVLRWAAYTSFVLGVILFGIYRHSQFIYFQF